MLFNSFSFLAAFAALAALYYSVPHRVRWMLLLVASLCFYATFRASHVVLLIGMTLVAYAGGLGIGASADRYKRRGVLIASIVAVLGVLFVFKYFDFFSRSIEVLPRLNLAAAAGLSFYGFSCVSYLADVYAGRLSPERHAGYFALYVSFFPKLLAGPIERARPFLAQVRRPVAFSAAGVTAGLQLMLWGLFKKVVIADRLAGFVDAGYGRAAFAPPADLLLATYFFAFQLYCDFSGYSDMAIGAASVLGFTLMDNFRRPYLSTSVSEFWAQRWHLSLTSWFRDYVYIPLGGNRVSRIRRCVNLMTVFLLSGLWHGANWTFVVWGALNGSYQVISLLTRGVREKAGLLRRLPQPVGAVLQGLATFHLILLTWVFFRAASLSDAATILSRVAEALPRLPGLLIARVSGGEMLVSLLLIAVLLGVEALDERRSIWDRLNARPVYVRWTAYYAMLVCFFVLGVWNLRRFVYMQF